MTLEINFKNIIRKIEDWDNRIFLEFYESKFSKKKKIIQFAKIISFFGNFLFWGSLWLTLGIYSFITKDYKLFILITGGFEQSLVIYLAIRYIVVKRNRPFITLKEKGVKQGDELIKEKKSFPSGHVTFFLFFGFIFAFYFNNWIILLIFILFDIIIAITRVILGVHFPIDVIFGFMFGVFFAFLFLSLTCTYWLDFYYWLGTTLSPFK